LNEDTLVGLAHRYRNESIEQMSFADLIALEPDLVKYSFEQLKLAAQQHPKLFGTTTPNEVQ